MVHFDFPIQSAYREISGAGTLPAVEIELRYGGRFVRTLGVFDSGSTHTVFSAEFADQLGIDYIHEGDPVQLNTGGGPVSIYQFQLEIEIRVGNHRRVIPGQVGFFAGRRPRNILGRILVFSHYVVGFRESDQLLFLKPDIHD